MGQLQSVEINNELFFKIANTNLMRPFFMSIVSDSNHWLFISSNGGLSAGRKNADYALFPYYSDDKITDTAEITGSKTIIRLHVNDKLIVWEPFSVRSEGHFQITRNLYQNKYSNKIIFEEINLDLGLQFQYEWNTSNLYGFVKKARLQNLTGKNIQVEVLDGMQNVLPYGIPTDLQTKTSNLADAYKRAELDAATGLGIFALSAIIVDKAEPSEALKANVVWSTGLERPSYLLSSNQLNHFRQGKKIVQEEDVKGEKGAYFIVSQLTLLPAETKQWMFVANVNQNHAGVIQLAQTIANDKAIHAKLEADIALGTENLIKLCAAADGLQTTSDDLKDTRHFSNVLFNIMRGGIFDNNYDVEKWDFEHYLKKANRKVYESVSAVINTLSEVCSISELVAISKQTNNNDFIRLATEYLPLKFSRRHGDPSRPWNQFSINTRSEVDGSKILDYQGNWRDIFQNWEALAHAYPAFIESMIYKFLNASTFDGYNPYRVTKDGFDWETIEPDNPWSYIGYWGDHQIIYLLKFLEFAEQKKSGTIDNLLAKNDFVYANVPYRIKSYDDIVKNPKDTIEFDHNNELQIHKRREELGIDGALLTTGSNEIYHVNFAEKILATVLSKLSNFVPEGGIWMNTQRPEWNDANNALVGNGLSMVTLCYLRRFLKFFETVLEQAQTTGVEVSAEVHQFFVALAQTFEQHKAVLQSPISDSTRKQITDALGIAGSDFRLKIYNNKFSGQKQTITTKELSAFVQTVLQYLEHSIKANKRSDNLYHAYNLLDYKSDGISVGYLSEMLEGQVGVLSAGYLSAQESLAVLDALKQSALYRADQNSYILYPNKNLAGFLQRNNIPANLFEQSELLKQLLQEGNHAIAEKDIKGNYHFNGNFKNANDVSDALNALDSKYQPLVEKEKALVLQTFEAVFNHKEFTGRSGTFYGYEGLGSIYWHMVSKLLLAAQESCLNAIKENADAATLNRLIEHYYNIQAGIGVHKSPELYGAFPITPYSHTPFSKGAQQPGMTGQVKEDILCRIGELGVKIDDGHLLFEPALLSASDFLQQSKNATFTLCDGSLKQVDLTPGSLAYTICQVPVVYKKGDAPKIEVEWKDGKSEVIEGNKLSTGVSDEIINRSGAIQMLNVYINTDNLSQ